MHRRENSTDEPLRRQIRKYRIIKATDLSANCFKQPNKHAIYLLLFHRSVSANVQLRKMNEKVHANSRKYEHVHSCTPVDVHVFWLYGLFLVVGYRLARDDPVDKEASYWYYVPKQ